MSPEEVKKLHDRQRAGVGALSQERKQDWYSKVSRKRRNEMIRLGQVDVFSPSYNPRTIPYIVDVLNVRYDTTFRHAESEGGEFKIYDREEHRFYYADAYCPDKNIWIEFDEPAKYYADNLRPEHEYREQRIKQIINCVVHRVRFSKNYV
jgi:hypothetical protein